MKNKRLYRDATEAASNAVARCRNCVRSERLHGTRGYSGLLALQETVTATAYSRGQVDLIVRLFGVPEEQVAEDIEDLLDEQDD